MKLLRNLFLAGAIALASVLPAQAQDWTAGSVTADMIANAGIATGPGANWLAGLDNGSSIVLDNGDYLQAFDESGNIHDILGVDSGGNTEIKAPSSENIQLVIDDTEQVQLLDGILRPTTDNDIDLGTASAEFKDVYIDGTANLDNVIINGTITGDNGGSFNWTTTSTSNTACTTQCSGFGTCVIGYDVGGGTFRSCANATSDSCICTGAPS